MTSKLLKKNNSETYYCSNCRMRQPQLQPNCWWCGDWFSNYESVVINESIEGGKVNESNLCRGN